MDGGGLGCATDPELVRLPIKMHEQDELGQRPADSRFRVSVRPL